MHRTLRAVLPLCFISAALIVATGPIAAAALTDPASGPSDTPSVSDDGRYVAFLSAANNLLGGNASLDTNGVTDAFVIDQQSGKIQLVSQAHGVAANAETLEVQISGDGRYVAFLTTATNLLATDANGSTADVLVWDRITGDLALASRRGATGPQGNGGSGNISISRDGSEVAFTSFATNLVANDTNGRPDAFVRDMGAATTTRVSTSANGKQANGATSAAGVSANGGWVGFSSDATNLVNGDINGSSDVFVKNLTNDKVTLISVSTKEAAGNGTSNFVDLSSTGRDVVFTSYASNLVGNDENLTWDVFDRDRVDGTTVRASQRGTTEGNAASFAPTVSPDGAFVAFATNATNLSGTADANGAASDVYDYEVATKTLRRVSVDSGNGWSDGASFEPSYGLSSSLVFTSSATDLVGGDVDGVSDVFIRTWGTDHSTGTTALCSKPLTVL
jgi:Tol biopolymer transport system component